MAAPIFSAMVLTASSQLMRSHSPAPRSPTRFMGYLSRSVSYTRCGWLNPFTQKRLRTASSPGISMGRALTTLPSRTVTSKGQRLPQLPRHALLNVCSPSADELPSAFAGIGASAAPVPATAATAVTAPVVFRKPLRVSPPSGLFVSDMSPPPFMLQNAWGSS